MKSENPLPKMQRVEPLPGAICAQYVRCGRDNCRCSNGQHQNLHGPYHYRYFRVGGRLKKQYVKASEIATVQRRCERNQQERRALAVMRQTMRHTKPRQEIFQILQEHYGIK